MSDCGCHVVAQNEAERRVLWFALALNAAMFVVGLAAGWISQSLGLVADALDMGADATAYAIGLLAWSQGRLFKARAAGASGLILLVLGLMVLVEVGVRAWSGTTPGPGWMMGVASLSLVVNATVLYRLQRFRKGEVHLRATWIFTRADVIANLGVIAAGGLVALTHNRMPDVIIGAAIALYILREAVEILREAREATP